MSDVSKGTKDQLNLLYHDLLQSSDDTCFVKIFTTIMSTLQTETSGIWKGAVKTLIKMLSYPQVCKALSTCEDLSPDTLILTLIQAKIEPIDHSEEE